MPVPSKTTARKAPAKKAAAKRAPAKKVPVAPALKRPAKKATAAKPRSRKPKFPTPPWRSWNLPPKDERDQTIWYYPHPDSKEYSEFVAYIREHKGKPGFEEILDELKLPLPPSVEDLIKALESEKKTATSVTDPTLIAPVSFPSGSDATKSRTVLLIDEIHRRYQSEPPRLYVVARQVSDKRRFLGTDLFDRGTTVKWTNDVAQMKLFGARDAANQLAILVRALSDEDLTGTLSYDMVPVDMLLFAIQKDRMDDQLMTALIHP